MPGCLCLAQSPSSTLTLTLTPTLTLTLTLTLSLTPPLSAPLSVTHSLSHAPCLPQDAGVLEKLSGIQNEIDRKFGLMQRMVQGQVTVYYLRHAKSEAQVILWENMLF